ncbi:Multidrug resistance outer membrane protein MdtP precursor [Buttiauxella agrestis]|uniref:Multidrug resistance outer membrane protein MdtP n=1 Tax=Buttiauxella agrestis TaxID=82977 RepID=A0A381CA86_9ENTR|nr:multidrug resistance outer membrane protein MdtQ [Buttiauxella agrestis]SUW64737.1 Multidrug resistance outer membrane protein MdtP precursor [Buttiauxella agrestis]
MTSSRFPLAATGVALMLVLSGCAPMHNDDAPLAQKTPPQQLDTKLPPELAHGWPGSDWWRDYHDSQITTLVERSLKDSPDLAVVQQRIKLAQAQTQMQEASDGPQMDFSANIERQKMSQEGVMGPFALTDPAAGTTGPYYTNGTFGLTASWDLDLWGKNRSEVEAKVGVMRAKQAELAQAKQVISANVVRLYWDMQTLLALKDVKQQTLAAQKNIVDVETKLYAQGINSSVDDVEPNIDYVKTQQQLDEIEGRINIAKAQLAAITGDAHAASNIRRVELPKVKSSVPEHMGYELLARRPDLQEAHWYIESSLSSVDAAKAAFYPDVNLGAFLQNDALHLSDLFRGSAQQMGIIGGFTLPIFDSGRLNANLDIVRAESNLSIASYNKAVVGAVNDVEKAASQLNAVAAENQHQKTVLQGTHKLTTLAQARYKAGVISGARFSAATLPELSEQAKAIQLHGQWLNADVQLISALGGGYHQSGKA